MISGTGPRPEVRLHEDLSASSLPGRDDEPVRSNPTSNLLENRAGGSVSRAGRVTRVFESLRVVDASGENMPHDHTRPNHQRRDIMIAERRAADLIRQALRFRARGAGGPPSSCGGPAPEPVFAPQFPRCAPACRRPPNGGGGSCPPRVRPHGLSRHEAPPAAKAPTDE